MSSATATSTRHLIDRPHIPFHAFAVLAKAGFRRYSTYRQATIAGISTNSVFGFLRCYVLLATAGATGSVSGYDRSQLVAYVWLGQGMLSTIGLWEDMQLSTRIRTGEVAADLLRPINPVMSYFATDLGRAGFALFTRFAVPVAVGMLAFDYYLPRRAITYPLFALSLVLACAICFFGRYVVQAFSYWLLDNRGPTTAWTIGSSVLGGLYFPLSFMPPALTATIWLATPFPSLLQAPIDIAVERVGAARACVYLGIQAVWLGLSCWAAVAVQRRGERKLVVQGG